MELDPVQIRERTALEIFGNWTTIKPNFHHLYEYDGGTDFTSEGRAVINHKEYMDFRRAKKKFSGKFQFFTNVWKKLIFLKKRFLGKNIFSIIDLNPYNYGIGFSLFYTFAFLRKCQKERKTYIIIMGLNQL